MCIEKGRNRLIKKTPNTDYNVSIQTLGMCAQNRQSLYGLRGKDTEQIMTESSH